MSWKSRKRQIGWRAIDMVLAEQELAVGTRPAHQALPALKLDLVDCQTRVLYEGMHRAGRYKASEFWYRPHLCAPPKHVLARRPSSSQSPSACPDLPDKKLIP